MGLGFSFSRNTEPEWSDDTDDIDLCFADPLAYQDNMAPSLTAPVDNQTDAVMRLSEGGYISLEDLNEIEESLEEYEIVSLIYLLYDDNQSALEALERCINNSKTDSHIYRWIKCENVDEKIWQKKLVEAMCIIQNYQILKSLGFTNKRDLEVTYMPYRMDTSCLVQKYKKVLYLIAENLTRDQALEFRVNVTKKMSKNSSLGISDCDYDYLELYFLLWDRCNVSVKDICHVLKIMDLESLYDSLKPLIPIEDLEVRSSNVKNSEKLNDSQEMPEHNGRKASTRRDNAEVETISFEENVFTAAGGSGFLNRDFKTEKYYIDRNNPGIVMIINQEHFYTEPDPQYQHLLHEEKDELKLDERHGTLVDRNRLKNIFSQMGFKVLTYDDLTHIDMIKNIKSGINMVNDESSLIICILSHGKEGVVFGANSCKVEVKQIQTLMCRNKRLRGKPKVLVLQSCQGRQCQQVEESTTEDEECDNATDGSTRIPPTADLLTFWATIPGYAAVRNVKTGSWFIQALCEELEQNTSNRYHFIEICTRASQKVTWKEWKKDEKINVMTPAVFSTLTKSFYLPCLTDTNR